MASHPGEIRSPAPSLDQEPELRLLVELQPRGEAFIGNVACVFRKTRTVWTNCPPGKFWTDVFVPRGLPWGRVTESLVLHVLVVTAVITVSNAVGLLMPQPRQLRLSEQIYHYDLSNYLPPLDTGTPPAPKPRKGRPLLAPQKIISLPERPDNFEQTIISPMDVKLPANINVPNIVAWTERPGVPSTAVTRTVAQLSVPNIPTEIIPPAPDPLARDLSRMRAPDIKTGVIEPPPSPKDLDSARRLEMATNIIEPPPEAKFNPRAINAPPPSVIEPPPPANVARNLGDMNMGHFAATVAAPNLPVPEQKVITLQPAASRASGGRATAGAGSPPPPPVAPVGGMSGPNVGQMIALNLRPTVPSGPISVPPGRRSGEFAVGPEGTADAPGTPEVKGGGEGHGGTTSRTASGLPTGITIGNAPDAPRTGSAVAADPSLNRDKETLMAAARSPRIGEIPRTAGSPSSVPNSPRSVEERVFAGKEIYTLALNMPNLSSSGGSWIIRFAQLDDDHVKAPVSAPVATRTVDPAYPADLMREGYEGTVMLYAVIHKDGTVGEVRILRGVQVRLDESARTALARWKFRPGTKNGQAVDLEAVVQIPFKASRYPY